MYPTKALSQSQKVFQRLLGIDAYHMAHDETFVSCLSGSAIESSLRGLMGRWLFRSSVSPSRWMAPLTQADIPPFPWCGAVAPETAPPFRGGDRFVHKMGEDHLPRHPDRVQKLGA